MNPPKSKFDRSTINKRNKNQIYLLLGLKRKKIRLRYQIEE